MQSDGIPRHNMKNHQWVRWVVKLAIWSAALGLVRLAIASVSIVSFEGRPDDSVIYLEWVTGTEVDLAGFNLWRRQEAATPPPGATPGVKLNQFPIPPASGGAAGATYWFTDTTVVNGTAYWYRLEWLDRTGPPEYREADNNPLVPGVQPTATPTATPINTQAAPPPVTETPAPTQQASPTNPATPQPTNTSALPPTATLPGPSPTRPVVPTATPPVAPTTTSPLATPPTFPTSIFPTAIIPTRPIGPLSPTPGSPGPLQPTVTAISPGVTPIVVTRSLPAGSATPLISGRRTSSPSSARATATALAAAQLRGGQDGRGPQSIGGPDSRRTGIILLGIAVLGLAGLGGLGYLFWRWSRPAPPTSAAPTVLIGPPPPPDEPEPSVWEEHDWRRPGSSSE